MVWCVKEIFKDLMGFRGKEVMHVPLNTHTPNSFLFFIFFQFTKKLSHHNQNGDNKILTIYFYFVDFLISFLIYLLYFFCIFQYFTAYPLLFLFYFIVSFVQ